MSQERAPECLICEDYGWYCDCDEEAKDEFYVEIYCQCPRGRALRQRERGDDDRQDPV